MQRLQKFLKWLFIGLMMVIALWFFVSLARYRIPAQAPSIKLTAKLDYKFLEIDLSHRALFEGLLGNRIVRLEGYPPFFVSEDDRAKLWPENPHVMAAKGYTMIAELEAAPLLFGGLSKAKLISATVLNEAPIIRK